MGWGIQMREQGLEEGLAKGALQGKRDFVLRLASRRFGAPSVDDMAWLESLDIDALTVAADRLLEADDWPALRG
jgi:hypothetical protein